MNDESVTLAEYNAEIETMAEQVIEAEQNHDMEVSEAVWEEVDSHQWIMYFSYNVDVLELSRSEPDEWRIYVNDDSSWKEVIQAMAYSVMEQDVYNKVRDLKDK